MMCFITVEDGRREYGVVFGICGGNMWLCGEKGGKNPLSPKNVRKMLDFHGDKDVLRQRRCHHRLRRQKLCRGPLRGPRGSPGKPPERGKCMYPLCYSGVGALIRVSPFVMVCWGPPLGFSPLYCVVGEPGPGFPPCGDGGRRRDSGAPFVMEVRGTGTPVPPL